MSRGRVLLFSRDPGGANTVIPLVAAFSRLGKEVLVYGKDVALQRYASEGIEARDLMSEISSVDEQTISGWVRRLAPDLVITGTSADDMTEKFVWRACEGQGIASMAILDQWMNYGIRFSRFGVSQTREYEATPIKSRHEYLPRFILVMDELAKRETVAAGIEASKVVVTGSPHFAAFRAKYDALSKMAAREHTIVFVSEPITDLYLGGDLASPAGPQGYTERTIFTAVAKALDAMTASGHRHTLVIRPHPKERKSNWDGVRGLVDRATPTHELIARADLIIGMSSMVLLESALAGKPVLSVQIGLRPDTMNPYVLERMGKDRSIRSEQELATRLTEHFTKGTQGPRLEVPLDAVERIVRFSQKEIPCLN